MSFNYCLSQERVLDEIICVVGNNTIKLSDLQVLKRQLKEQAGEAPQKSDCELFEQILFQKMLAYAGQVDSVEVSDKQVEGELDRRIRFFSEQLGGEQKVEEFYKKSISKIKDEFRDQIKEQLLVQNMQGKITGSLTMSPSEVRTYYNSIPKDSLPFINSEVEIGRIIKMPPVSDEERANVKEKLTKLRDRIIGGTDFASMAALYSEDPGSAPKGGELGFLGKGQLVPEFEMVAFGLKPGDVSRIVETQFGYHIIQLIERRGELYNFRHILLIPKTSAADIQKASETIDTVYKKLTIDKLSFEKMCVQYSDEKETKFNSGLMVNSSDGTTKFEISELDKQLFFAIDGLKPGEVSKPLPYQTPDGKKGYQLLFLKSRSEAHVANLIDDYQKIQNASLTEKQSKTIATWINKRRKSTFIRVNPEYKNCVFKNTWF